MYISLPKQDLYEKLHSYFTCVQDVNRSLGQQTAVMIFRFVSKLST